MANRAASGFASTDTTRFAPACAAKTERRPVEQPISNTTFPLHVSKIACRKASMQVLSFCSISLCAPKSNKSPSSSTSGSSCSPSPPSACAASSSAPDAPGSPPLSSMPLSSSAASELAARLSANKSLPGFPNPRQAVGRGIVARLLRTRSPLAMEEALRAQCAPAIRETAAAATTGARRSNLASSPRPAQGAEPSPKKTLS
mmetsp:Transcript_79829/g.229147  ORF Transcript_79829/g.229147 Transcript_79829/m.229147 type:complete len:202 (+) Transcript_79829:788-1393(+)